MKVFISWSGERSRLLGDALRKFVKRVIQRAQPWYSPDDISKGASWVLELGQTLDQTDVGILCITSESVNAAWLLFEAGSLSKKLGASHVMPYLLDFEPSSLRPPLGLLNATRRTKDDTRKLFDSLNRALGGDKLRDVELNEAFDKWWPDFETEINAIKPAEEQPPTPRTSEEQLQEVLALLRTMDRKRNSSATRARLSGVEKFETRNPLSDVEILPLRLTQLLVEKDLVLKARQAAWEDKAAVNELNAELARLEREIRLIQDSLAAEESL